MNYATNAQIQGEFLQRDSLEKDWSKDSSHVSATINKFAYWLNYKNINDTIHFRDAIMKNNHTESDPYLNTSPFRVNLGYFGSQSYSLLFEYDKPLELSSGYHAREGYRKNIDNLKFLVSRTAYADFNYSQSEQSDLNFSAIFSKTFKNTTLFIDYDKISYKPKNREAINTNYLYNGSIIDDNSFQIGIGYLKPNKKYQLFLNYYFNEFKQADLGGYIRSPLVDSLIIEAPNSNPRLLELSLSEPKTRVTNFGIGLTQHFGVNKFKVDSSNLKNNSYISHTIHFGKYTRNHYNKKSLDASYYSDFTNDIRGVRNYLQYSIFENQLSYRLNGKVRKYNNFEFGLKHQIYNVNQDLVNGILHFVWATGKANWTFSNKISLKASTQFGLLGRIGNYKISGILSWQVLKGIHLIAQFKQQLQSSNLLENRLYINKTLFWDNNFTNELHTLLGGTLTFDKLNTSIGVTTQNIGNYIYVDSTKLYNQFQQSITNVQFKVSNLSTFFKVIKWQNTGYIQLLSNEDLIPLPKWGLHSKLYIDIKLFDKKLHIMSGVNLKLYEQFSPYAFNVLIDEFYIQNNYTNNIYPNLDAFFQMQRSNFIVFLRLDNILTGSRLDLFQPVDRYFIKDFYLRFGISWLLYN